jgi:type II secretory pathway pseudopilin PulG
LLIARRVVLRNSANGAVLSPVLPLKDLPRGAEHYRMRRSVVRRTTARDESGFSLIETVLALFISAVMFSALTGVLIASSRASVLARQNQQAGDLLNESLESVRALDYAATAMVTTDPTLTSDALIKTAGATRTFKPGSGSSSDEPLVLLTTAAADFNPHITTVTRNNTAYTVQKYVTCPSECASATNPVPTRRVTVVVTWATYGVSHERRASTAVVHTRRGLPLPYFRWYTNVTQVTSAVGGSIVVPLILRNLGARDGWNITSATTGWTYYIDSTSTGTAGTWDSADVAMTSANGYDIDANGQPDTGYLQTSAAVTIFAVRTATVGDVGTTTAQFTAHSVAQPTATSAKQSLSVSVNTKAYSCPGGCVPETTYLRNQTWTQTGMSSFTDSVALGPMAMDITAPYAQPTASDGTNTVYRYSTDVDSVVGRFLQSNGSGPKETDLWKTAAWHKPMNNACLLKGGGVAEVNLYYFTSAGADSNIVVYVGSDANSTLKGTFSTAGTSATVTLPGGSGGWKLRTIAVPITVDFALSKNDRLALVAIVPGSSAANIRLAYDVAMLPANATFPLVRTAGKTCLGSP